MPIDAERRHAHSLRSWMITLLVLLGLFGSAFIVWVTIRYSGKPEVDSEPQLPDPVEVASIGHVPVEPANNAFELYRQAARLLQPMSPAASEQHNDAALESGWEAIGTDLRGWLEQNRRALNLFKKGSERDEAVYWQPDEQTPTIDLHVVQQMRGMVRLAE